MGLYMNGPELSATIKKKIKAVSEGPPGILSVDHPVTLLKAIPCVFVGVVLLVLFCWCFFALIKKVSF